MTVAHYAEKQSDLPFSLKVFTVNVSVVDWKIEQFKPQMKIVDTVKDLPDFQDGVFQVKADGEFSMAVFNRNSDSYTLNQWGKMRTDFSAVNQFAEALRKTVYESVKVFCELYAKEDGKPLRLDQFISIVKSGDSEQLKKVHIGVWAVHEIDGQPVTFTTRALYDMASEWFKGYSNVGVLPYVETRNVASVQAFFESYVLGIGYEGIVCHVSSDLFKIKPKKDLDAVILGFNKKSSEGKPNRFRHGEVTSLHIGLIGNDGNFLEIGDVGSGIDLKLRKALFQLTSTKTNEDEDVFWIKPQIIVQVSYYDLYINGKSRTFVHDGVNYHYVKDAPSVRLRSPVLLHFRPDKKARIEDIGMRQLPLKTLQQLETN